MWILLKLIAAAFVIWKKMANPVLDPETGASRTLKVQNGIAFIHYKRSKSSIVATRIKVDFPRENTFKIKPESFIDKFFKMLGLAYECTVSNQSFDEKVYLQTDAPDLAKELGKTEQGRMIVLALLKTGCKYIEADTKSLTVHFKSKPENEEHIADILLVLARELQNQPSAKYSLYKDPFFYKALVVEAFVAGVACYGAMGLVGAFWGNDDDWMLDSFELALLGVRYSIGAIILTLAGIFVLFIGSSRGHRLIIENALIMLLGFPAAGATLAGDVNVALDKHPHQVIEVSINNKEERITRSRRSGRRTNYYIIFDSSSAATYDLPDELEIDREMYNDLHTLPVKAKLAIGKGYLNKRYIKGIKII